MARDLSRVAAEVLEEQFILRVADESLQQAITGLLAEDAEVRPRMHAPPLARASLCSCWLADRP